MRRLVRSQLILGALEQGQMPYLVPPVIRFTEARVVGSDFDR